MSKGSESPSTSWLDQLVEVCELARRALEPGLDVDERGMPVPGGSCLYASVLVASLIKQFTDANAIIRGGSGEGRTGAVDTSGAWHGHYWVEVERSETAVVVDITGDQFGHRPVRILGLSESREVLVPGEQDVVDAAASAIRQEIELEQEGMRRG